MHEFLGVSEQLDWILVGLLGLLFGSLANVIILRLPQGKSIVRPRSHCPSCSKVVAWYDNIPVVSWIILLGRCRNCRAKISWRYPLVEALTGLLFVLVYKQYGVSWFTLEALIFVYGLIVVSFIDFDHMILPDVFTLSGIVLGLTGAALNPEREFMAALWGFLAGGGFLWATAYLYFLVRKQEGLGGGDIKLLGWIGAVLGWEAIPFVILGGSAVGLVVGIVVAIKTKAGGKAAIPFGPYLSLGAIAFLLGGDTIRQFIEWYFSLFFAP